MALFTTARSPLSRFLVFPAVFTAVLFLSGCPARPPSQPASAGGDVYVAIDAPDETVEPYQPIDDGKPLTREELAAFESVGELDANLSGEEMRIVELHFKFFVHNNRKTVERFLKRSEMYMPFVNQVFKERGLPEELACLAFVESGFNPNAVSRAGAGGMWQFMPYTGKKYGLSQNRWLDERRDPYKATEAAAAYLAKLHGFFHDWHLAIAAYNAGEGKIGRALAGTDAKTFFEICRRNGMLDAKTQLKEETQQYLPRFLAFVKIVRNAESLGFVRPDPKNALDVVAVDIPAGVDLRRFAQGISLNWEQFRGLNPAYLRGVSPPHAATSARVPASAQSGAADWLKRKDAAPYAGWRDYRVRGGDSLGRIAHRTGATVALLRQVNGRPNNAVRVGEYLLVPGSARAARAAMGALAPDSAPRIARAGGERPSSGPAALHTIVSGDTLFGLAMRWGVSVDDICETNGIDPASRLRVGRKISIPSAGRVNAAFMGAEEKTPRAEPAVRPVAAGRGGAYAALSGVAKPSKAGGAIVVRSGDTLYSLARAHGTSVNALVRQNGISVKKPLRPGQVLHLP